MAEQPEEKPVVTRGERGPAGDHGQAGDTGLRGATGERGSIGQQGLTGDAGQAGSTGERGYIGAKGDTGFTGAAGGVGAVGPQGVSSRSFVLPLFALFLSMLGIFALLAWRIETNTADIRDAARTLEVTEYLNCRTRNENIERLNSLWAGLSGIERDNPYVTTSPQTIKRRMDLYAAAQLDLIDCGDRP